MRKRLAEPLNKLKSSLTWLPPRLRVTVRNTYDLLRHRFIPSTLWFDDGYSEDYTVIFPLLQRYNLTGILGIITGRIGKRGFLTIPQLREMIDAGWLIASHSVTHTDFLALSLEDATQELRESYVWIQTRLGVNPVAFMPIGGANRITPEQHETALQWYSSVCNEPVHFHSLHFRDTWQPSDVDLTGANPHWTLTIKPQVKAFEQRMLTKVLRHVDTYSPFFKASLHDIHIPQITLPPSYTLAPQVAGEMTQPEKHAWETFTNRIWCIPPDALVVFIKQQNRIVATGYCVHRNGIGVFHAGYVDPQHRKQGFYSLFITTSLQWMVEQGITEFEVHTNVPILWTFWERLGFHRVGRLAPHAYSKYFSQDPD